MLQYARSDTHFLFQIYDSIKNELLDKGMDSLIAVLDFGRKVEVAPII